MIRRRDPFARPEVLIRRVYAYVAWRIGAGPDAEDVTSDVFERALRYRDRYDAAKGDPIAWLLGIARRCVDGALASRPPATELPDLASEDDLEQRSLDRLALTEAVASLDERDRELIALRYGADLKAREIAQLLGMRTNAVEVALHRALGRLRAMLDEEQGPKPSPVPGRRSVKLGISDP